MKATMKIFGWMVGMLVMATASVSAQKTLVKGVVIDSLTQQGEPFATIRIYKQGDREKPVAMNVTDMDGVFAQEVNGKGAYEVLFSSVGKANKYVSFQLNGQAVMSLDTIYVAEDMQQLKGVEVVAQRPLVKMEVDKMSYNTADDVDAKSSTVLEMLRKVPMVTVHHGEWQQQFQGLCRWQAQRDDEQQSLGDLQEHAGQCGEKHRGDHQSGCEV